MKPKNALEKLKSLLHDLSEIGLRFGVQVSQPIEGMLEEFSKLPLARQHMKVPISI